MRFLAVVAFFAAGCSAAVRQAHVAMTVQGPAAGPAEQQRCLAAVQAAGAVVDGNAPVQAIVTVDKDGGRLQVLTMRRGLVRDEKRAGGTLEALCRDAAAAAVAAHEPEPVAAPAVDNSPQHAPEPTSQTSGGAY